jgi:hypothetical protein
MVDNLNIKFDENNEIHNYIEAGESFKILFNIKINILLN